MKILAFDTSTRYLSLGLYDDARVYEYDVAVGRKLSALLGPAIKRVTEALKWDSSEIDYFACGIGPGSFTAIRIGMAMIKGLAWSVRKPVVGISTLDIIAHNALGAGGYAVPVMDAKRNLVYTAFYRASGRVVKRLSPYMLLNKEEFFRKIKEKIPLSRNNTVAFLGDGLDLLRGDILTKVKGAISLDKDYWYPRGHKVVALALERIGEKKLSTAFDIKPIYLYPKECQIRAVNNRVSP